MIVPFVGHAQPLAERVTGVTGVRAGWLAGGVGWVVIAGWRGTGLVTTTGVDGAGVEEGLGAGCAATAAVRADPPLKRICWPG